MEQVQLTSRVRTSRGKGAARQLRREGLIPAVLYGGPSGNIALSVNSHDLRQIIVKGGGEHALISLAVEDEAETKNMQVILKDLQLDPVKQTLVHADFLEITMGQVLEIEIPFELTGESPGVKTGGVLEFVTREITVKCLPSKLRDHISVDISSLEIGDILTVGDIDLGEDYEILTHADVVIATVAAPLTEEVLEEAPEEEQLEPEVIQKGKKVEEEE
jgi:large subunit ribosomal protein L25